MIRFLQTPGKGKKIFFSLMLGFICIAMVWYLVPQGNTPDAMQAATVLAKVGDREITYNDVQQIFNQYRQPVSGPLVPRAVDSLIGNQAEILEAHRLGLEVSDGEVQQYLHQGQFGEALFPKGKFIGTDQYSQFVSQNFNTTVDKFEAQLKTELLTQKLENLVDASAAVTPEEIQREFLKQNTKVKLQYAVLTPQALAQQINPTEAELKAFYDSSKAELVNSIPEKRKAQYIVIDLAKLQQQVTISPQELEDYYNQHREDFRQQSEVKASHILIKTPQPGADGKVDPKADAAARAKAQGILDQLKAGANFADLAKKDSDDKASAINGGSLGWFQHGQMVPEFEQAAFSLPVGQTSGLVKTQYGYHIIRVEDRHEPGIPALDAVKDKIEPLLKQEKAGKQASDLAQGLQSEVRARGFAAAAAAHNLQAINSDWFARNDSLPGIGASADFMQAAFSAAPNSPPQAVPTQQGYVVFQIAAVQPPGTPTFEQARAQLENEFKNQRAQFMMIQKVQELSDRAHALHDLKKAAAEVGAEIKTTDWLGEQGQAPDLGSMSGQAAVAFTLKPGEISGPIINGISASVLMVTDRQEPPAGDLAKSQDQLREQLLERRRQEILQLYRAGLTQRMEKEGTIKKNQQQIDALAKRVTLGS
jgi:peptidyl-prolyl cis-trans isomerase D